MSFLKIIKAIQITKDVVDTALVIADSLTKDKK